MSVATAANVAAPAGATRPSRCNAGPVRKEHTVTRQFRPSRSLPVTLAIAAAAGLCAPVGVASAQDGASAPVARQANPRRETLMRLSRPVTIAFEDQRLEDVMAFLESFTGAPFETLWLDNVNATGFDPDMEVNLKFNDVSALDVVERILVRAGEDAGDPESFAWQLSADGTFEVGPKDRLNQRKRLVMYDINDLIIEIPDYSDAPEFDLQSVLQASQGGGGGGGQSPFTGQTQDRDITPKQDRADEIMLIITTLVEPDEWVANGGDGASIRYFQNHLVVRAPDYVHRQIDGYPFWPRNLTRATYSEGRRNMDILPDPAARRRGP